MSTREIDSEIAKFETTVRLINWENAIFVVLFVVGFVGAAVNADSTAVALTRSLVASIALVSCVFILAKARYRLKAEAEASDLRNGFRKELARQARLRRLAPLAVVPLVAALLLNAWVVSSILSLVFAFLIAFCAWVNVWIANMWRRGAAAIESTGHLHNWTAHATDHSLRRWRLIR